MKIDSEELHAVVDILKKRFNNLSATEILRLATDILEAIEKEKELRKEK